MKSLRKMTEDDLTAQITTRLAKHSMTPYQQHQTEAGPCDLYIFDKRVIIEVKKLERLDNGPNDPKSGDDGRTAFEQLEGYINAERTKTQRRLDEKTDETWIGCVTDSVRWWVWVWPQLKIPKDEVLQDNFNGAELDDEKEKQLINLFQRSDTEPVPDDPTSIFEPHMISLSKFYERVKDFRSTKTQKDLWFKQLEASGNAPTDDIDDVFVRHTLLILISRLVSFAGEVRGGPNSITDGFVQWVDQNCLELRALKADIESYDWKHTTGDVLRALYMGFILKKHRKMYGEYYTPDWLAEELARTVVDEKYIKEQLDAFQSSNPIHGVLDPACGSGTLLYHAGRIIMSSKAVKEASSYMNQSEINDFLCAMLHGIDIHPVAVEMTRTNIHRLLPLDTEDQKIQVFQGDSLLLERPSESLHSSGGKDMVLYSPKKIPIIIPKNFLSKPSNIEKLVRTAKHGKKMPPGLTKFLDKTDAKKIKEVHTTLTKIIKDEGNGVWEWYIKNQAAPLLLQDRKVGRIISNPPWVRINHIQVKLRKELIISTAKNLRLWVGGAVATSFDIAALFVDKCRSLYLTPSQKSGWLLLAGSMKSDAWKGLRDKIWDENTRTWDLGEIPFKQGFTCSVLFNINTSNRQLTEIKGQKVKADDFLSDLVGKIKWEKPERSYEIKQSEYIIGRKVVAKNGATIFPYNLVRIKTQQKQGNIIKFETVTPTSGQWKHLGSQSGKILQKWVQECLYTQNLYPYIIKTSTSCIIPLKNNKWDSRRTTVKYGEYWRKASDLYKSNCGKGKNTPKTLRERLDYGRGLFNQIDQSGWAVVYNGGGRSIYAMKIKREKYIIEHGLYYVPCQSEEEADFLSAILNASSMLPAFIWSKSSKLFFGAHIWKKIPIPKFNPKNNTHQKMVTLSRHACEVAEKTYSRHYADFEKHGWGNWKMGKIIRGAIQKDVGKDIDDLCRVILPDYAA